MLICRRCVGVILSLTSTFPCMSYFAVWDSPSCLPTLGGVRVSVCPTAGLACLADSSHPFQDGATSPPMCSDSVVNTVAHSFCNKKCQTGFSYVFPYSFLVKERWSKVVTTVTHSICEKAPKKTKKSLNQDPVYVLTSGQWSETFRLDYVPLNTSVNQTHHSVTWKDDL